MKARGTRRLMWVAASFLVVSSATRIGLAVFSAESFALSEWARFMAVGSVFDLAVLPWFLLPWAVYDAATPEFIQRHAFYRWERRWAGVWAALYLSLFAVVAAAEFTFWAEFGSRFDFIAVDYLIYTKEVIGNIRESYPVGWWLIAVIGVCLVVSRFTWPRGARDPRSGRLARWRRAGAVGVGAALSFLAVDFGWTDWKSNAFVEQLSANGIYALIHAFRYNELDYEKYYPMLETAELNTRIRSLVRQPNATFTTPVGIEREIAPMVQPKKVNIVLVTIESLSADFLGRFGNQEGLTPELDKLAGQGLLFTNLFATGTRSVRGLEALSVGTPPTPGQSIVRRPENSGLENLGEELKENGWSPYWIYGGYGYIDNMNAYFEANEYAVVDRTDIEAEGISVSAENIWGIADEDLYSLVIANMDREYAKGNRFFAHVMTTSNHRPYTFPENRVDQPQRRRQGAVQYTDWAIGDFIRRAAKKPWFDDTLFVFVSDHTAKAAGKTDLPPSRYRIPMIWYAPKLIEPGVMDRLMSQIDVGPTLMGWLGLSYTSRFFGYDMFNLAAGRERAFISTYQKLGYLKGDRLVVLDVNRDPIVLDGLPAAPGAAPPRRDQRLIDEAISWYQSASQYFRTGLLIDAVDDDNE